MLLLFGDQIYGLTKSAECDGTIEEQIAIKEFLPMTTLEREFLRGQMSSTGNRSAHLEY